MARLWMAECATSRLRVTGLALVREVAFVVRRTRSRYGLGQTQ